jgi:hypothetical protein
MERILWEKEPSPLHSSETVNITPLDDTAAAEFEDHDVSQVKWDEFKSSNHVDLCSTSETRTDGQTQ